MMTLLRIAGIALCLALAVRYGHAGSVIAERRYDDGTVLSFIARTRPDFNGVWITAAASVKAPLVIQKLDIQANKTALAKVTVKTCASVTCVYGWPHDAMSAGSNDITLLVTLTNRSAYTTTGTFGQPPSVPPSAPINYCTDSRGFPIEDGKGGYLTC